MNNIIEKKKTRAEKILADIETKLRELIAKRKELEMKFRQKIKELDKQRKNDEQWFGDNMKEANKIENQMMILWDYWKREIEILKLEKKKEGMLPSEREELQKEISKLNSYNIILQKSFSKGKINAGVVTEIRERLKLLEEKKE